MKQKSCLKLNNAFRSYHFCCPMRFFAPGDHRLQPPTEVALTPSSRRWQSSRLLKRKENFMGVSKNRGTPKSSILIGFSIINYKPSILVYHYFGNTLYEIYLPPLNTEARLPLSQAAHSSQVDRSNPWVLPVELLPR